MNGQDPHWTRRLRQGASAVLTVACVATTLATSSADVEGGETEMILSSEVFNSTMILFEGETEGQVVVSLPTSLLEDHHPVLHFQVDIAADRLSSSVFPATTWEGFLGDQNEPIWSINASQAELTPPDTDTNTQDEEVFLFASTWNLIDALSRGIPITTDGEGCSTEPCLPCDTALGRCELPLPVRRQASLNPTARLQIICHMEKPGEPREFNTTRTEPEVEPAERGSP